jgi:reactive intermediate/imine deaminase
MQVVGGGFREQAMQTFKNLLAVAEAAGGTTQNFVKLNIYLTDLANFTLLNDVMQQFFNSPYPARAAVEVSALPRGVLLEIEGVVALD